MVKADIDALDCDFMEYYHIDNFRRLPLTRVAVFAYGLPDDSRIKRKLSGQQLPLDALLLASIFDQLNTLLYSMTKDAKSGKNRPQSLVKILSHEVTKKESSDLAFTSGKDFNKAYDEMIQKIRKEESYGNTTG